MKLTYSENQLYDASSFIFRNNAAVSMWPDPCYSVDDVVRNIKETMMSTINNNKMEDLNWVSTGGYTIMFIQHNYREGPELEVEFMVDPAIYHVNHGNRAEIELGCR